MRQFKIMLIVSCFSINLNAQKVVVPDAEGNGKTEQSADYKTQESIPQSDEVTTIHTLLDGKGMYNQKKMMMGGYAGLSFLTAKLDPSIPSFFKSHIRKLQSGYSFGGFFRYYHAKPWGFGLKYAQFNSENTIENVYATDSTGNVYTGKIKEDLSIRFFAASVGVLFTSNSEKFKFTSNIYLGYMTYNNDAIFFEPVNIKSSTVAVSWDAGISYVLDTDMDISLTLERVGGVLTHMEYETETEKTYVDLPEEEWSDISRVDVSFNVVYKF